MPTKKKAAKSKVKKKAVSKKAPARKKVAKKKTATKKVTKKTTSNKKTTRKVAKKTATKKKAVSKKKATSKKAPSKKKVAKKVAKKKVAKKTATKKTAASKKTTPSKKKAVSKKTAKKTTKKTAKKTAATKKPAAPARKKKVARAAPRRSSRSRTDVISGPIHGVDPYQPKRGEEYMSDEQLEHFRDILSAWKNELMEEVDRTVHHMQDEAANFPDPNDRATQESEFGLELRTRDRERKLLRKISSALTRIDDGSYGYCEETGEEIGLKRLEARPVATLCLEAQERRELSERQFRDRDDRYR